MNFMRLTMRLVKRKRDREECNIGNNIDDERSYEDRGKIIEGIRGDFRDRFKDRIEKVQKLIIKEADRAGQNSEKISYIMVSKGRSVEEIKEAYSCGIRDFGENRLNQALQKKEQLPDDIRWHFIGRIQKNKIGKMVGHFSLIHSVDSFEVAELLSNESLKRNLMTPILLQANTSGETSKAGLSALDWEKSFNRLLELKGITLQGLMTMAPLTDDETEIRNCFKGLKNLQICLQSQYGVKLELLSMGMSHDFLIAIQEGATLLRLGSIFFETTSHLS